MLVSEMLDDIVARLPVDVLKRYGEPGILRMLNRLYTQLNRKYKLVYKSYTPDFSGGLNSFTLPDDFVAIISVDTSVNFIFVDPNDYDPDSSDTTISIKGKSITFTGTDASSSFVFYYQSSGYSLVNKTSGLGSAEVNEPEWPDSLHDVLFYGVCTRLSNKYDMYQTDLVEYENGQRELSANEIRSQEVTPHIMGDGPRPTWDDYGELL